MDYDYWLDRMLYEHDTDMEELRQRKREWLETQEYLDELFREENGS